MGRIRAALGLFRRFARLLLAVVLLLLLILGFWFALPDVPRRVLSSNYPKGSLIAFSPDGRALLLSEARGTLNDADHYVVWNLGDGNDPIHLEKGFPVPREVPIDFDGAHRVAFSPDNRYVAVEIFYSLRIFVWDAAIGALVADVDRAGGKAYPLNERLGGTELRFTPDGRFLLYAYHDGDDIKSPTLALRCWDVVEKRERLLPEADFLWGLAFAADGGSVLLVREGKHGKKAVVWRLTGGPDVATRQFECPVGEEHVVACTADLSAFATVTDSGEKKFPLAVKVRDVRTGAVRKSFSYTEQRRSYVTLPHMTFTFGPGGESLLVRSTVYRHRMEGDGPDRIFSHWDVRGRPSQVGSIHFERGVRVEPVLSRNHRLFAVASSDCDLAFGPDYVELWDAKMLQKIFAWSRGKEGMGGESFICHGIRYGDKEEMPCVSFSPDGKVIALTMQHQSLTGPAFRWLSSYIPQIEVGRSYDVVRFRDTETSDEVAAIRDGMQALFAPDGQSVAVLHTDGRVAIWDLPPRAPWLRILGWAGLCWAALVLPVWGFGRYYAWRRRVRLAKGPAADPRALHPAG